MATARKVDTLSPGPQSDVQSKEIQMYKNTEHIFYHLFYHLSQSTNICLNEMMIECCLTSPPLPPIGHRKIAIRLKLNDG